ncbi:MFS transporter [Geochorda subterranea]|uniref:MFS transporter n=1 Tax=Geochorda subterranea TaxID=3109564 RepID=A0ABZ1BNF2_9FIRM|nr:MFS transporter [Limnochorda sp. LNt]WRP14364.1 MFS transporter [Limnochorda sp. LNt]
MPSSSVRTLGGSEQASRRRSGVVRFIVLMGLVSLFADMTYEGARSATGPFLLSLGASAAVVGTVAGLGELLGYALRLVFGFAADRLRRYWLLTGLGYAINLLAVPLLALAGRWEVAAGLVLLERIGKAIRTPSRDAMLSFATREVGRGFGFGLHEMLDQIGAVAGPLLVAGALWAGDGYRRGFAVLLAPALASLVTLAAARRLFPAPHDAGDEATGTPPPRGTVERQGSSPARLGKGFWAYVAFSAVTMAGFAHFQLISYHLGARALMAAPVIPLAFAVAMGVDALAALASGRLYDRVGLATLLALPVVAIPATALAFGGSTAGAWAGVLLWGAALGIQETVMRAAVADLSAASSRGRAYGLFNTSFGLAWFAGSALMGLLYERSAHWVVAFAVVMQVASLPLLWVVLRHNRRRGDEDERSPEPHAG